MKVIGYGICGPGEASRYMRETLEEFKRLCDEVVILVNVDDLSKAPHEIRLINEYGFSMVADGREWGKLQWKIKQDFLETHIAPIANEGDMLVCLDMDEVLDAHLTKQWLLDADMDAYHVFVVDLWNDPEHYKLASCFWNVRIWRWNGNTEFVQKPVHCGLAPQWAYHYHRHAPFILKHKGLMKREDRQRKIARYEKYDPDAKHLDKRYYKMLADDTDEPFDEEWMHTTIAKEVATYKQTKPRELPRSMTRKKERFAYVKNSGGYTVDIPERHLAQTLKRPGFTFIGWAEDAQEEIAKMFDDSDQEELEQVHTTGMRSTAYEKAEVDALNAKDDEPAALQNPDALFVEPAPSPHPVRTQSAQSESPHSS